MKKTDRQPNIATQQFKSLGIAYLQNKPPEGLFASWQSPNVDTEQAAYSQVGTAFLNTRSANMASTSVPASAETSFDRSELVQDIGLQVERYVAMRLRKLDSALETVNESASEVSQPPTEESVTFAREVAKSLFVWLFTSNLQAEGFDLSVGARSDQGLYLMVDVMGEERRISFSIDKKALNVSAALLVGGDIQERLSVTQPSGSRPLVMGLILGK